MQRQARNQPKPLNAPNFQLDTFIVGTVPTPIRFMQYAIHIQNFRWSPRVPGNRRKDVCEGKENEEEQQFDPESKLASSSAAA